MEHVLSCHSLFTCSVGYNANKRVQAFSALCVASKFSPDIEETFLENQFLFGTVCPVSDDAVCALWTKAKHLIPEKPQNNFK